MSDSRVFVTVQGRGVIAIPTSIRRHYGLDRPGAQVEVFEREGEIVLRPQVLVPAEQTWFWSERWQKMEFEANEDIASGRVVVTAGVDEFIADLNS